MASSSGVQQTFQQQFKCNECGLALNSAESLDVHRQYHDGNLMQQWTTKKQNSNREEKNNNMSTNSVDIKREFASNHFMRAESSGNQKKSPDYHPASPEVIYGHPPTPQSYQSNVSSPYQNNDNPAFSPNFQPYQQAIVKSEPNSLTSQQPHYQHSNFSEQQHQQFFTLDSNNSYFQKNQANKVANTSYFRYEPYGRSFSHYESPKSVVDAPRISPTYPPQPTPSPSPKQCDKCGYVCESAAQLIEHNNLTHSNNVQLHSQYNQNNHFMFDQQNGVKEEDAPQNEILDLDSQKVVHPDWENGKESDKRSNSITNNPHSVSAMLSPWPPQTHQQIFQGDNNIYDDSGDQKMFIGLPGIQETKMYTPRQKKFQSQQIDSPNFINNTVTSSNPEMGSVAQQPYRAFEHLPPASSSPVTSNQVPSANPPTAAPTSTRSANWKSNAARRPKTYKCTACNKWFTSSGHLKRHYNTTLHKNAVKSSGHPDPATMPISAHHHPSREPINIKEETANSNSPEEDSRGDDSNEMSSLYDNRLSSMTNLVQQPPNGPYDRPSMHHTPPMQSPMGQHHTPLATPSPLGGQMIHPGFSNMVNGSSPNGEAGLSPPESRGLLSMPATSHHFHMMPQPQMMQMEANQFQMYPNGSAPHVTQTTDTTSNLNITGEQLHYVVQAEESQPLPSFAQIQAHRFSGGYADVGGMGLVTAPGSFAYFTTEGFDVNEVSRNIIMKEEASEYKFAVLQTLQSDEAMTEQQSLQDISQSSQFSPSSTSSSGNNNNNNDIAFNELSSTTNIAYVSPESSQHLSQPIAQPLNVTTTDVQGESKENYEECSATGSPSISSTVITQEELSKTKCFDCDKVFNRPCYLTQHNKTCHNGEKPFKCPRCGKKFSDEETYKAHIEKHAGDKPHKCAQCPKMFNHKTDLRRHICWHTGRKPYACEVCGKGFIRKDHMVKHVETHQRKKEKIGAMRN